MKHIAAFFILCLASVAFHASLACYAPPRKHEIDPTMVGVDVVRPPAPVLEVAEITRGVGPVDLGGGAWRHGSTDGTGVIRLSILSLADDRSPKGRMGLRIVNAGGPQPIEDLYIPDYDVWPDSIQARFGWTTLLIWSDGSTDAQEPISQRVLFFAVDAAGNVSVEADTLLIEDPGRSAGEH